MSNTTCKKEGESDQSTIKIHTDLTTTKIVFTYVEKCKLSVSSIRQLVFAFVHAVSYN